MIGVVVDIDQPDCPFVETTSDHPLTFGSVHWEFDTERRASEARIVAEADDAGALDAGLSALRDHRNTRDISLLRRQGQRAHLRTTVEETAAMAAIRDNRGYVTGPFHTESGSERWRVGFDRGRDADAALSALDRENDFSVLERSAATVSETAANAGAAMTLIEGCRDLSETERETLEEAVSAGYFESPRDATLGSLAEEFGVSKPAVSKNLRRGERKMIERVIAALEDMDS